MQRRHFTLSTLAAMASLAVARPALSAAGKPHVTVYKDAGCGCCGQWIAHLQANGFTVTATDVDDTGVWRRRLSMPERFGSCHTAQVSGYAIEGHVPAADILRLLKDKPVAVGLAVTGMPAGSPGMESPRNPQARAAYDVLLVKRGGEASVYRHYDAVPG